MQVQWIQPESVGAWEIETFADCSYRLELPPDGRATIAELADLEQQADGEPTELLAWGRYDEITGLGLGATVGERLLLVFEPAGVDGNHVARVTQSVVHILQTEGR